VKENEGSKTNNTSLRRGGKRRKEISNPFPSGGRRYDGAIISNGKKRAKRKGKGRGEGDAFSSPSYEADRKGKQYQPRLSDRMEKKDKKEKTKAIRKLLIRPPEKARKKSQKKLHHLNK